MTKGEVPLTAAEMRTLADQAEAEAAAAEALAAAARARGRAIRLRREARVFEPEPGGESAADETARTDEAGVASADAEGAVAAAESDQFGFGLLSRPNLSLVAAVLAVGFILVTLGATVEMMVLDKNAVRERQRVAEFAAAARQGVVTLTSLDFEHPKEGVQRILEVSMGRFKDDFLKTADDFANSVQQSKLVSQGTVQATAVDLESLTDNSAVVLVASTSEVTDAAGIKQDPRKYRLVVTVGRDGGQLKMSEVEFIP